MQTSPVVTTLLNHELDPGLQTLELSTSLQIPAFQIIGLPGPEVSEARERVKAALENAGFEFPRKKVVLNLSPSSVRKQGTGMDLAMALILILENTDIRESIYAWGELGLDGRVKSAGMVFRALDAATSSGANIVFMPREDRERLRQRPEFVRLLSDRTPLLIAWISDLKEALDLVMERLRRKSWSETLEPLAELVAEEIERPAAALPGVNLPASLQRVVGAASAGRHHVFLAGARGAGKSLSLEWLEALMPAPSAEVLFRQTLVSELRGVESELRIRRVGVQVKSPALFGSVQNGFVQPGEFTLADGGLLVADEFPEWPRDSREAFREPLERGRVTLSRVGRSAELPADFQLAATGNLCACGGEYSEQTLALSLRCRCLPQDRTRYLQRISGPILDRIDCVFRVANHPGNEKPLPPEAFREKVGRVRERLIRRYGRPPGRLVGSELEMLLEGDPELSARIDEITFSSFRERHRSLRLALTLAEWDGEAKPQKIHLHEVRIMREAFLMGARPQ